MQQERGTNPQGLGWRRDGKEGERTRTDHGDAELGFQARLGVEWAEDGGGVLGIPGEGRAGGDGG